jgi:AcrR family transcriptional regulator
MAWLDEDQAPARGELKRRLIVAAALRLGEGGGLDGLSLQAVADAAGVPKSLVLHHFGSRDGLLLRVAAAIAGRAGRCAQAVQAAQGDPRARLNALLDAWLLDGGDDAAGRHALHVSLWAAHRSDRDEAAAAVRQTLVADDAALLALLETVLAEGHRHRCWQAQPARQTAQRVRAVVEGVLTDALRQSPPWSAVEVHARARSAVLDCLVRS